MLFLSDKEAPEVLYCPDDQSVQLSVNELRIQVTWKEPQFGDNIQVVHVKQTHKSGNIFRKLLFWKVFRMFNPIELRKAKIAYNFGLSEFNRVKYTS